MRKKIVLINNVVGNFGVGRVMNALANGLYSKGYDVTIFFMQDGENGYEYEDSIKRKVIFENRDNSMKRKIARVLKLREILKENNDSTFIVFEYFLNMQVLMASFGLKRRIIISERNDPNRENSRFIIKNLRNLLYKTSHKLVCQTEDARKYFPDSVRKKAVVIPNPIKSDLPNPHVGERRKVITNFCRLNKQKNLPLLIDSFEKLVKNYPEFKLEIYGDGPEKQNLTDYISKRELDKSVFLYDSVSNIHEIVKDAYLFVSSSDYEGLSNSMIEAMAIGIPSICTDCPCGGAKMIIKNGVNGLLVPVNDSNKLYLSMKEVLDNPKKAEKLSTNGVSIRDTLAVERIVEQWSNLL